MRHWSLMDALVHAPDLVARLRCFKEGGPGRQVITYVLAQLGIPIVQVRRFACAVARSALAVPCSQRRDCKVGHALAVRAQLGVLAQQMSDPRVRLRGPGCALQTQCNSREVGAARGDAWSAGCAV